MHCGRVLEKGIYSLATMLVNVSDLILYAQCAYCCLYGDVFMEGAEKPEKRSKRLFAGVAWPVCCQTSVLGDSSLELSVAPFIFMSCLLFPLSSLLFLLSLSPCLSLFVCLSACPFSPPPSHAACGLAWTGQARISTCRKS